MTREQHFERIKALFANNNALMLKLPTSFGKCKISIDLIQEDFASKESLFSDLNILIVVPRLVLFDNWKDEFKKWGFKYSDHVTFTTYVSFPKHADISWDYIIFDEGHHFTENCADAFMSFRYNKVLFMSATFPREQKYRIKGTVRGIAEYTVTARDAINDEILPDPKVILIPMMLDNTKVSQIYIKNKSKSGSPVKCYYKDRFNIARENKRKPIHIYCTQQEYYTLLNYEIDYWKDHYISTGAQFAKNIWLRKAKDRLEWLAQQKEEIVKKILISLKNYRTLTFCTSIEQTERLGKYPINSKNKSSGEYLDSFNLGEINHITAVGMLNEGVNLVNCQIGIYANTVASEVLEIQRLGRILRHTNPLIIVPYFLATREQEIVEKTQKNYNEKLTHVVFPSQLNLQKIGEILNENND